jgi:hypothetical protein
VLLFFSYTHFSRKIWLTHELAVLWQGEEGPTEFTVGTVDEEFLITERDEKGYPMGGFGKVLANQNGNWYWSFNEIKGVNDVHEGVKYKMGSKGEKM